MSRGPSRPAAHIKPEESSKATAERKRPAAAKRNIHINMDEILSIYKKYNRPGAQKNDYNYLGLKVYKQHQRILKSVRMHRSAC